MKREYWRRTKTDADKLLSGYWAKTYPFLFCYLRVKPAKWATETERLGGRGTGFFLFRLHMNWRR